MRRLLLMTLTASVLFAGLADAATRKWTWKDPAGDDDGPGSYVYPTDQVYKGGSFDLRQVLLVERKNKYQLRLTFNATLENPWNMEGGFSVQMAQVYLDLDGKGGKGARVALPGMNANFEEGHGWEHCIIVSPQPQSRIRNEVEEKVAEENRKKIVIPQATSAVTNSVMVTIDKDALPELPDKIGLQVLIGSNEGFPDSTDLLARKVNEYEGAHRFGGGSDWDGDPHFIDIVMPPAEGKKDEIEAQHKLLSDYKSSDDASKNELVELVMVYQEAN